MTLSVATVGIGVFVLWFGLALALPWPKIGRWLGGMVIAIILAGIGSAIGGWGGSRTSPVTPRSVNSGGSSAATSSSSPPVINSPAPTPSQAQPTEASYDLALLSGKGYESEYGGYHIIEGLVKNVSDRPLKNVAAVGMWYDKTGEFIKSDDALIDYNPILPGQTSPFKTMSTGNPAMARYSVEFKTLMGGTLSVDDRRKKK